MDCQVDVIENHQYSVTLKFELWAAIHPQIEGVLCIECVEKRIGRLLTPDDFNPGLEDGFGVFNSKVLRQRVCRDGGATVDAEIERLRQEGMARVEARYRGIEERKQLRKAQRLEQKKK